MTSLSRTLWFLATGFCAIWPPQFAGAQDLLAGQRPRSSTDIANFGAGSPAPTATPAGTVYLPPKVLTRAPVEYPTLADLNRIEGVLTIRFYIDEAGHVTKTAVAKTAANPLLSQLNGDPHLLLWTFQPATLDGKPVPSVHDQEFEFRLDPKEQSRLALKRLSLPMGTPDPTYPAAAAALHLQGSPTIEVRWTKQGLVDRIGLVKSSGSPLLDATAVRFAYENWHIDPAATNSEGPFVKTIKFAPAPPL